MGCKSKAQPLDVVINKLNKDKIRKLWTLFMQVRQAQAKDSLSLVGPSHQAVTGWMEEALACEEQFCGDTHYTIYITWSGSPKRLAMFDILCRIYYSTPKFTTPPFTRTDAHKFLCNQ